jgi:hypothetical protein
MSDKLWARMTWWLRPQELAGPGRLAIVYLILAAALAAVVALVVADRRRIIRLITRFLPGYAGSGELTKLDVQMLASTHLRRLARQWARLHGGPGSRAMAQYQLAATDLALACDRDHRGLLPPRGVHPPPREHAGADAGGGDHLPRTPTADAASRVGAARRQRLRPRGVTTRHRPRRHRP